MSAVHPLNDREALKWRISEEARKRLNAWPVSTIAEVRTRNDEIARQYLSNGVRVEVLADLFGMTAGQVRKILSQRKITVEPRSYKPLIGANGRAMISLPAPIRDKLPEGAVFTPELVPEGVLYRAIEVRRA